MWCMYAEINFYFAPRLVDGLELEGQCMHQSKPSVKLIHERVTNLASARSLSIIPVCHHSKPTGCCCNKQCLVFLHAQVINVFDN